MYQLLHIYGAEAEEEAAMTQGEAVLDKAVVLPR